MPATGSSTERIEFNCNQCNGKIAAPANCKGKKAKCGKCGAIIQIPDSAPFNPFAELAASEKKADGLKVCPACAEIIKKEAKKCRYCGEQLVNEENDNIYKVAGENPAPQTPRRKVDSSSSVTQLPAESKFTRPAIKCAMCGAMAMRKKKVYRMSGAVVVIGYIFLVPCILGILMGFGTCIASMQATNTVTHGIAQAGKDQLRSAGIPERFVEKIAAGSSLDSGELMGLTAEQRQTINDVELQRSAAVVGAGLGGMMGVGGSIVFGGLSFIGGLLGWLLIMKKTVLQCSVCSAVVAAS